MIAKSLGFGAGKAMNLALVVTLWAWTLALTLVVAVPAWSLWGGAFNHAIEANRLLDGFSFALFAEASQYGGAAGLGVLSVTTLVIAALALVGNALVSGGILEVLLARDDRPFFHRFFRGVGHFFLRFAWLLVLTGLAIVVGAIVVGIASAAPLAWLGNMDWEPAGVFASLSSAALVGLVAGFFYLVLDYARIRVALDDTRSVTRGWLHALVFVGRHLLSTVAIGLIFAVATVLVLLGSLLVGNGMSARSWLPIILATIVYQAGVLARAWLRVAMVGSEVGLYQQLTPRVAPVRVDAPARDEERPGAA
jgi:hypothetical protein